jgi:transcriptional regulator with XRE-family HTH domain
MFFGNEHLGRAVAFLRDSQDLKQYELAAKIGLKPGTLNQYESGRRSMNEDLVKRVAEALRLDPITIWDTAFRIFRYNYFLERADEEGIAVEELIDRAEMRPSVEQIMESYDSKIERERQYTELTFRFLASSGRAGLDSSSLLKVVVNPRSKGASPKKAVRLDKKTPQRRNG